MSEAANTPGVLSVRIQRCVDCKACYVNTRTRCAQGSDHRLECLDVDGRGRIFSWTVTHVPMSEWATGRTPYVTVLVELAEGVRLLAHWDGPAEAVQIDGVVKVRRASAEENFPAQALIAEPAAAPEENS